MKSVNPSTFTLLIFMSVLSTCCTPNYQNPYRRLVDTGVSVTEPKRAVVEKKKSIIANLVIAHEIENAEPRFTNIIETIYNSKYGDEAHDVTHIITVSKWYWMIRNKTKLISLLLFMLAALTIGVIVLRMYRINVVIKYQEEQMAGYAEQLQQIIDGTDKLVHITWKDLQENIKFADNPAYKTSNHANLTKAQLVQTEIERYQKANNKVQAEIDLLKEKEGFYIKEVTRLERDVEFGKRKILDEVAALGFAEHVVREFK